MHICALTNAKLKLNKRSYLLSSSSSPPPPQENKAKAKLLDLSSINNKNLNNNNNKVENVKANPFSNFITLCPYASGATSNFSTQTMAQFYHQDHQSERISINNNNNNRKRQDEETLASECSPQQRNSLINLPLPSVSIIKPLMGVDRNLFNNLETFYHLDYPNYEILFCIQDHQDPAIEIVKQLFKKYPKASAKLFLGGSRVGVNPKINNMQPAYEAMKYELLLISDSGISMRRDTLLDMVSHMRDDVALVHQMPFVNCHGRDSFQSIVERVYFGTAHARAYLTADLLNLLKFSSGLKSQTSPISSLYDFIPSKIAWP